MGNQTQAELTAKVGAQGTPHKEVGEGPSEAGEWWEPRLGKEDKAEVRWAEAEGKECHAVRNLQPVTHHKLLAAYQLVWLARTTWSVTHRPTTERGAPVVAVASKVWAWPPIQAHKAMGLLHWWMSVTCGRLIWRKRSKQGKQPKKAP